MGASSLGFSTLWYRSIFPSLPFRCTSVGDRAPAVVCPWLAGEDNRRERREEKAFIRPPPFRPGTGATGSAACRASRVLLVEVTKMPLNVACVLWALGFYFDGRILDMYGWGLFREDVKEGYIWAVWATLVHFNLSPVGIRRW